MMLSPKISVIVPIYKTERYLQGCIDSILSQTFCDFELLLIDDGSPDNSGKLCDKYVSKDSRVRVFHKKNGGVSSARNIGIENANGEWIYFLDSDDALYPNTFSILLKNICEDVAYVMAGYVIYNEVGEEIYSISTKRTDVINARDAISQMFAPKDYLYHGYLWNKLFRLDIIKRNNLRFAENIYFNEDRLFNVLYLRNIGDKKCIYMTEPVYKYIERSGSAMSTLKRGYNPKFATDLTAFISMLKVLKYDRDYKNMLLCKQLSYSSYIYNVYLMKKFGSYTKDQDMLMYRELRQQLSFIDIVYLQFRRWLGRLKCKILNIRDV